MCNELNNVRVIFTNSELQAHDAKSYPLQRLLSPRPKSSAGPIESSGRNIVPHNGPLMDPKGGRGCLGIATLFLPESPFLPSRGPPELVRKKPYWGQRLIGFP